MPAEIGVLLSYPLFACVTELSASLFTVVSAGVSASPAFVQVRLAFALSSAFRDQLSLQISGGFLCKAFRDLLYCDIVSMLCDDVSEVFVSAMLRVKTSVAGSFPDVENVPGADVISSIYIKRAHILYA
jgi:hypothetical protein